MFHKSRASRFVASALLVFGLMASPAFGETEGSGRVNCTRELLACYWRSAALRDPMDRFVAALDCQIEFAGCVRRAIVGV